MRQYLLAGILALAGCAAEVKSAQRAELSDRFDRPRPKVNINSGEVLLLSPNSTVSLTIEDRAQKRAISSVNVYFISEKGTVFELDIAGSVKDLESEGKAHFCWYVGKQYSQIPEGPGKVAVYITGKGQVGLYEVPATLRKYDEGSVESCDKYAPML